MAHFVEESHKTFTPQADIPAGSIVKLGTLPATIVVATAATDVILGVVNANAKTNFDIDVRLRSASGTLSVKLGGTVALGAAVTTNGSGLGIATTTAGNQILGYAIEAGVAGAVIELLPSTAKF